MPHRVKVEFSRRAVVSEVVVSPDLCDIPRQPDGVCRKPRCDEAQLLRRCFTRYRVGVRGSTLMRRTLGDVLNYGS